MQKKTTIRTNKPSDSDQSGDKPEDRIDMLVDFLVKHDITKINLIRNQIKGKNQHGTLDEDIFTFLGKNTIKKYQPSKFKSFIIMLNWGWGIGTSIDGQTFTYTSLESSIVVNDATITIKYNLNKLINIFSWEWLIDKLSDRFTEYYNHAISQRQAKAVLNRHLGIQLDSTGRSHLNEFRNKLKKYKKLMLRFEDMLIEQDNKRLREDPSQIEELEFFSELDSTLETIRKKTIGGYDATYVEERKRYSELKKVYKAKGEEFVKYIIQRRIEKGLNTNELDKLIFNGYPEWTWMEKRKDFSRVPRLGKYVQIKEFLDLDDRFDDLMNEATSKFEIRRRGLNSNLPVAMFKCLVCGKLQQVEDNEEEKLIEQIHCDESMQLIIINSQLEEYIGCDDQ